MCTEKTKNALKNFVGIITYFACVKLELESDKLVEGVSVRRVFPEQGDKEFVTVELKKKDNKFISNQITILPVKWNIVSDLQ